MLAQSPHPESHRRKNIWIAVAVVFGIILVGALYSSERVSNNAESNVPSVKQFSIQEDDVTVVYNGPGGQRGW